jgi:acetyl esterase
MAMPLDRQTQVLLEQLPLLGFADPRTQPIAVTRSAAALMRPPLQPARSHLASVSEETLPGPAGPIRARIYRPRLESNRPLPTFVYFHGGGWVLGDLDGFDGLCCAITRAAECVTVSVDYRLAPEHRYPAAVEDCDAALQWAKSNVQSLGGDPERLMVGGDSAGGNLAAVCCLRSRARPGLRVAQQILIYPVTTQAEPEFSSRERLADGYFLTRALIGWFTEQYVPDRARRREPDASPLLADSLVGLPPALVLTADYDPLVDEGEAYARRLIAAGVPVRARRFLGTIHGFVMFHELLDQGRVAIAEIAHAIRSYLPMGAP